MYQGALELTKLNKEDVNLPMLIMSWRLGKRGKIFTQLFTAVHWQSKYSSLLLFYTLLWKM